MSHEEVTTLLLYYAKNENINIIFHSSGISILQISSCYL
jgi:hypothetical protein